MDRVKERLVKDAVDLAQQVVALREQLVRTEVDLTRQIVELRDQVNPPAKPSLFAKKETKK